MILIVALSVIAFIAILIVFGVAPFLWSLFGSNLAVAIAGLLLNDLGSSAAGSIGASAAGALTLLWEWIA